VSGACPRDGRHLVERAEAIAADGDPLLGRAIDDRFDVIGVLPPGSTSTAYRAFDRIERVPAFLKVVRRALVGDAAFRLAAREASALRRLGDRSLAEGFIDGDPYVVRELLLGETIDDALRDGARCEGMCLPDVFSVAAALAHVLAQAHERGLAHGDVSLRNAWIAKTGAITLIDWGEATEVARTDDIACLSDVSALKEALIRFAERRGDETDRVRTELDREPELADSFQARMSGLV
jgi:serine/threonine protein kinase